MDVSLRVAERSLCNLLREPKDRVADYYASIGKDP